MIKKLMKSIREYKTASILTSLFVTLEVVIDCILPLLMARLIDEVYGNSLSEVFKLGLILVGLAFVSLLFGTLSGRFCAKASCGFARNLRKDLYYKILSELTGTQINNEHELIDMIKSLSDKKNELGSFGDAISEVNLNGFGVVTPSKENIQLDEPVVIKNGNKYGVKMKASANAIHMIRSAIETEIAPIVGSEQQAQDLITYIKGNAAKGPEGIWQTNIFGKSIEQIVADGKLPLEVSEEWETNR